MRYLLTSWKMYPTVDEARALLEGIQAGLAERARGGAALPRVIICPPFVALAPLHSLADQRLVSLGAQTCHWEAQGPYTGEISPRMLAGLVDYVLVGHSERRAAGETDQQVAGKVAAVAAHGMVPILLVGEDHPGDDAIVTTERRLRHGLAGLDLRSQPALVVYEPVWAIGGSERASANHIVRAVTHLKAVMTDMGATSPEILYGGTVNDANVGELAGLEALDGVGAGRASLDVETLLRVVDAVSGPGGTP